MQTQEDLIKISRVLEKMGHHVIERYNQAGILVAIYIDGKQKSLKQLVRLWRYGR